MGYSHGGLRLSCCSSLLLAVSLSSLLSPAPRAGAAEHAVGSDGINGWDTGTNFAAWAAHRSFAVGDVLVFQYVKSQHNAYEVTESTYRSCDASTGVLKMYTSGYDRVELTEPRGYWFICTFPGHCDVGGMRFGVNVTAPAAAAGGGGGGGEGGGRDGGQSPHGNASSAPGDRRSWWVLGLAFCVLGLIN